MKTTAKTVIDIGSARGIPGELAYGAFDAVTHPSGGTDQFPIIIAQGRSAGPTLWLTASIHGDEYTGIMTIHEVLTPELVSHLHGTIIAVPTLSPSGLRAGVRSPHYLRGGDPNRLFPGPKRTKTSKVTSDPDLPSALELAYRRLFESITQTADYLIDLHNYNLGAIPFVFRDPVYYFNDKSRPDAEKLQSQMDEMLAAFGHTIINEFVASDYLKKNLHRSVSGSVLNMARIPAFTAELGGYLDVDYAIVAAAGSGIRNVLRWAGMLDSPMEFISGVKVINPGYPVRRMQHPFAPQSGIVRHLVSSGDWIKAGQAVARLTDIYGRPIGDDDGLVRTEHDGFVLGVSQGATCYQNDHLLGIAVRDDSDLLLPFPE